MKYLNSERQDTEISIMEDNDLQKILLLPDGRKFSLSNESMLI